MHKILKVLGLRNRWTASSLLASFFILLCVACPATATSVDGILSTWAYNREDTVNHWLVAPVLSFSIKELGNPALRFETTLRGFTDIRHETSYDRQLRILRGVLIFAPKKSPWEVRLGQQWLTEGVGRGNVAGLWARYRWNKKTSVTAYGGARLLNSLSLERKNIGEGMAAGIHARTHLTPVDVGVSYFYLGRSGELLYHALGVDAGTSILKNLRARGRFGMNIAQNAVERAQLLAEWTARSNVLVTGEFRSQTPRVFEDSYFTLFLNESSTDYLRANVRWNFYRYLYVRGGGSTLFTDNPDPLYKVHGALGCRMIELGYTHWLSFDQGTLDGFYAQAKYPYRDKAEFFAGYDFARGSNADTEPENESHSAYLGISVTPVHCISLSARGEQISDLRYSEDWRGLFSVTMRFSSNDFGCCRKICGGCCK